MTSKFLIENRWLLRLCSGAARFCGLLALLGTGVLVAQRAPNTEGLERIDFHRVLYLSLLIATTAVKALIWIGIGIALQKVIAIVRESKTLV